MLCDQYGYSSARCNLAHNCQGSGDYCASYSTWASTAGKSLVLYKGSGGMVTNSVSRAFSARCGVEFTISKGKGDNGLMLCEHYAGYSSAVCYYTGDCNGAYRSDCNPNYVWSATASSRSHYLYALGYGTLKGPYYYDDACANSARCADLI